MAMLGIRQVPLEHSSLDFSGGAPNTTTLAARPVSAVVADLTRAAEKRSYLIVRNDCPDGQACRVTYKKAPQARSKTVGYTSGSRGSVSGATRTFNMEFSARLFATVRAVGSGVTVEMLGVPVIDDTPSCPGLVAAQHECTPQPFNVPSDKTPAQSFQAQWGVDISGKSEADDITGILAELRM